MCLRLKGDWVRVCILHQKTDFSFSVLYNVSLYLSLMIHLSVFKVPSCTFSSLVECLPPPLRS